MSNFTEKVLVSDASKPPSVWSRILVPPGLREPRWRMERDLLYRVGSLETPTEVITVEKGFLFNGHSVPFPLIPIPPLILLIIVMASMEAPWQCYLYLALFSILPRIIFPRSHPEYLAAAAMHDWLYTLYKEPRTRSEADALFRESLAVLGTGKIWRTLMWLAVRFGGWTYWYQRRQAHGPWPITRKWISIVCAPLNYLEQRKEDRVT